MKRFSLLFILNLMAILGFGVAHGQLTPPEKQMTMQSLVEGNAVFRSFDDRYKGVKGGITLLENWVPGTITMNKGQVLNHDKVNYDAYNGELIILRNNQEAVVSLMMVQSFVLKHVDDTLHFARLLGVEGKPGFFQKVTAHGKVVLYKKIYKTLVEPDYKGAYSAGRDYAEFLQEEKLFFMVDGEPLKELKNRKAFLSTFPDQEEALEKFIRKEKTDFKDEQDLRDLFAYLNQILA
jgi:hypothetical protein